MSLNFYEKCDECTSEIYCGIRDVMIDVRDATLKILGETSLADMIEREDRLKALLLEEQSKNKSEEDLKGNLGEVIS